MRTNSGILLSVVGNVVNAFRVLVLITVAAIAATVGAAAGPDVDPGFCVIVNAANPAVTMTRAQVARFFLKEDTTWPDDRPVDPVDLAPTSPVRARFSKAVLGRSVKAVEAYWHRKVFRGEDVPPVFTSSEEGAAFFVASDPNAIGYVSVSAAQGEGIKIVPVVD